MKNKHWIKYLNELKVRLLWSLGLFAILFSACFYFHKFLFTVIALPLLHHLPINGQIIATTVTAPFVVPIQISFLCAILIGLPFYLYQLWSFVAPALYSTERKSIAATVILSLILFLLGITFAYFIFLPLAFKFLIAMTPKSVQVMTDMGAYLDFVIKFFFAFGLSFQVPIIILLLVKSGAVTVETLKQKRPYIIVGAFIIGMLLTPPDVVSQILLAFPLWGLFEFGLLLVRWK